MASHLLCRHSDELKQTAHWEGSSEEARNHLLHQVQQYIPPSIMIPPERLQTLISQALLAQVKSCKFHRGSVKVQGLLQDHSCNELSPFPIQSVQAIELDLDEVWEVAFAPSGDFLALAGKGKSIHIVELTEQGFTPFKVLEDVHLNTINSVSWGLDGLTLLTAGESIVKVNKVDNGECLLEINEHTSKVSSVAWVTPDTFITGGVDRKLILWNLHREQLKVFNIRVRQVILSGDRTTAAVINAAKPEIILLNLETYSEVATIEEDDKVISVSLSHNGDELLVNSSFTAPLVKLWDLRTQKVLQLFKGHYQERFELKGGLAGPNEIFVVIGGEDGNIHIWNKLHGTTLAVVAGHTGPVNSVAVSPSNSNIIVSCGDDSTVRVWAIGN